MGFSASDVVPASQACANLSELAGLAKACIDAKHGLTDPRAGRTYGGRMLTSPKFNSVKLALPQARLPRNMAERAYPVEQTASFLERLDAIEAFLTEAKAAFAIDDVLAELRATASRHPAST
jgi:hypothetical protein